MKYIIGITFLLLFSCQSKRQQDVFSPPGRRDINDIILTIINQQNLPVFKYLPFANNQMDARPSFCIDLEKITVASIIYSSSVDSPPPPPNTVSAGYLLSLRVNNDRFFQKQDSMYFLFESEALTCFRMSKEESDRLMTTSTEKRIIIHRLFGLPRKPYYALSIPVFSLDHKKAYVILYYVEGMNSYAKALYLEKDRRWKVVKTQMLEAS